MSEPSIPTSSPDDNTSSSKHLARIDVEDAGTYLEALDSEHISLRRACEALGISYAVQLEKLKARSWATVRLDHVTAADGKSREMAMMDHRTFGMWLATVDENAVSEEAQPVVIAFQRHAADAITAYFKSSQNLVSGAIVAKKDREIAMLRSMLAAYHAKVEDLHTALNEAIENDECRNRAAMSLVFMILDMRLSARDQAKVVALEKDLNHGVAHMNAIISRVQKAYVEATARIVDTLSDSDDEITVSSVMHGIPEHLQPGMRPHIEALETSGKLAELNKIAAERRALERDDDEPDNISALG
jgi:P22_AR N-terminal domain